MFTSGCDTKTWTCLIRTVLWWAKNLFVYTIVQLIKLIGSIWMTVSSNIPRIHRSAATYVDHFLAKQNARAWTSLFGLGLKDLFRIKMRFSTPWSSEDSSWDMLRLLPRIDNFRVCVFPGVGEIRHIDVNIQSTCPRGISGNVTKDPESKAAEATEFELCQSTWSEASSIDSLVNLMTFAIKITPQKTYIWQFEFNKAFYLNGTIIATCEGNWRVDAVDARWHFRDTSGAAATEAVIVGHHFRCQGLRRIEGAHLASVQGALGKTFRRLKSSFHYLAAVLI